MGDHGLSLRTLYGCGTMLWSVDTVILTLLTTGYSYGLGESDVLRKGRRKCTQRAKVCRGCLSTDVSWTLVTTIRQPTNQPQTHRCCPSQDARATHSVLPAAWKSIAKLP